MHPYATDSNERRSIPKLITVLSIIVALGFDRLQTHTALNVPWWLDSPSVIGFYGMLHYFFNKSLWKFNIFRRIGLVKLPNLNGIWKGYAFSSFDNYTKEYEATFTIRQNWNGISIVGEFEVSKSHSTSASILIDDRTGTTVNYSYTNEPSVKAIKDMEMHHGFTNLIFNSHDQELSGTYYSGRGRQNIGELKLKKA